MSVTLMKPQAYQEIHFYENDNISAVNYKVCHLFPFLHVRGNKMTAFCVITLLP
jgi:hypothetical protein